MRKQTPPPMPLIGQELDSLPPVQEESSFQRLLQARWILISATIGLLWLSAHGDGERWRVVLVLFVLCVVAAFLPRQRKVTRLKARLEAQTLNLMPDVHMCKLAAALPDPCFILDRRGIVRFLNESASNIFSNMKEGDPLSFRIRQPEILSALDSVLNGGAVKKIQYVFKSHSERMFEAWVAPIQISNAPVEGKGPDFIILLMHDQTEQKTIDRMRSDFVANASHELRTPLASVIGFIETLLGPAKGDSMAQERFLPIMLDQATRMSRLVNDLMSLSRIEMKAHVLPDTKVDLTKILLHVTDALAPLAKELDVKIITADLPEGMWIAGERDELVQVFENLVENALKYGQDGKKIEVNTTEWTDRADGKPYYVTSIRDYGPGIAKEHLPRLTERFYRIDVASSRERKGTGLGLAIVKHILTRHRGRLVVESEVGKGSTFQVRLPISQP